MLERIAGLPAQRLNTEAYVADFGDHFTRIEDVFWKLERRQTFREIGDPGFDAFTRGDWEAAMRFEEHNRERVRRYFQEIAEAGFEFRRIRVVEAPVSPYLQWEMQAFRIRAEEGERIRTLDAEAVADRETRGTLPEIVILGTLVLYEILYDDTGTLQGARKITDREVIDACRTEMDLLWGKAEDLGTYFAREIAPLPPPPAQR